jgi:hypothetical protein
VEVGGDYAGSCPLAWDAPPVMTHIGSETDILIVRAAFSPKICSTAREAFEPVVGAVDLN